MSKFYKLGCNWGKGQPSFYSFIRNHSVIIGDGNKNTYQIGDYVLITEGFNGKAIGKISGNHTTPLQSPLGQELHSSYNVDLQNWVHIYPVTWVDLGDDEIIRYETQQGIIEINKHELKLSIQNTFERKMHLMKFIHISDILKQKKQIILQGAPGTGKTYISAEIALRLIEPGITYKDRKSLMKAYQDKVKAGQIAFTTFHQSMDYEEFVEGLKPVAENEKISYAVQPGIFKRICTDAMEQGGLFDIESAIEKFKDAATDNLVELTTKTGLKFSVSYRGGRTFSVKSENSKTDENSVLPANIESIKDLYRDENCKTMYSRSYVWGILNHLKTEYKLPAYDVNNDNKNGNKNYVLIIDEINRGNISKILGELITLLESDKRLGEENQLTVKLPYTHTENPDAPEFGVPSNLYIIGTMNSADRSVGHIDYAIRRRFAFVTLKSEKSAIEGYFNNLNKPDALKDIALKLFDDVVNVFNDISPEFDKDDLMIGHSYFMADSIDSLRMKLDYEIRPLLIEYLKDGILKESAKESIGKLSI